MEKKTILIVEDDVIIGLQLKNMLVNLGYNVPEPVATGEEAIVAVAAVRPDLILPDLILMDIQLAGEMDGITAAGRICSVTDVPVVFLTEFSQDPLLQRAKAIAPYGYLIKPVSLRELTATLEMALYKHLLDRQLKETNNELCLAQVELKEAREDLEKKVQERTQELQKTNEMLTAEIEKRMKSEEVLRQSEARFKNLLQDVQSVAVQGYAVDGTTQYWNQASEQLYGYSAQEAIGRNLLDLIVPPEMLVVVAQAMQQMAETGQPIPAAELSLMRKDGSRVSVFSNHAIVQVPGRMQELFCIDIDITERKQA